MNDNFGHLLVAHRGFSSSYPENTLLAVQKALDLGACYVEVDVHLSADKVPMVIHDANLQRTAGKAINIMDQNFAQLTEISVHEPDRFGDKYQPQPISHLHEVVGLLRSYSGRTLFIEAKRASIKRFGVTVFLDAVAPVLESCGDQCVLISFNHELLAAAKQRQLCKVGWIFENWQDDSFRIMDSLQPDYLFTDYTVVPGPLTPGPWRWAVYTIDDAELALQWFGKGADLVETNSFGVLVQHHLLNMHC
jgi:glycerophosphoryl diester phosphodiesterase